MSKPVKTDPKKLMDRLERRHIEIRSDGAYWWDNGSGYKIDRLEDLKRHMTAQEIEDCITTSGDSEGFTTVYWKDGPALYNILRYRKSWNIPQNTDDRAHRSCCCLPLPSDNPELFAQMIEIALSGKHG